VFKKLLIAMVLLGLLSFIWGRYIEPRQLKVSRVELLIPGLPPELDGLTILHLSDLHEESFGPNQERQLTLVNSLAFDLVVFTGDAVDRPDGGNTQPLAQLLAGLNKPIFAVYGNHDYAHLDAVTRVYRQHGVHILANEAFPFSYNNYTLRIAGIHDPFWSRFNYMSPYLADLDAALAQGDTEAFTILLSHSPDIIPAAQDKKLPLVLMGHTHGGQVKIPLLGAPVTASGRFFAKHVQGVYQEGDTTVYINRGLGTTGLPIRFLSPPEVALLTLRRAD
jgi:predicted MPP superfamily phosphohydrolase